MNKYKICVYAISKNEEKFVDRWMDSVGEADLVVVADTGSTDKTVEKLRARNASVFVETISPWRFDTARNAALAHVPEDVDICVSNDLDEVFEPGWRQKLEQAWQPQHTRARYSFVWSHHPDNTPNKKFSMEKIHRRHDFKWVRAVHEILDYSGTDPDSIVEVPNLMLHHYPDNDKPRGQYLPLLELAAADDPSDDRIAFWLGREYMYHKQYDRAIETLKNHLKLPKALWNEERSASMRYIALCFNHKGETEKAIEWLYKAIGECPTIREPYLAFARLAYQQKDWEAVFAMAQSALLVKVRGQSYLVEPESWGYALYDLAAISAYYLGLYATARDYAAQALALSPDDPRLKSNLELISKKAVAPLREEQ